MKSTAENPLGDPGFRTALLTHYDRHARALPWRGEADPYRILVSEVMLQQTRVETVKRYYDAWLDRFPTVTALAEAQQDEVLKAWEGLGYYRRARNLQAAAIAVRERDGAFPRDAIELRTLPGVGEYTAGAVAGIAFGEAVPAVDGNVRRVFGRIFGEAQPTAGWLRERAAALVDRDRPGDWNQAVMELGATVCRPIGPMCGSCPVQHWCTAYATSTQADLPGPLKRARVRSDRIRLAVLERDGRVLLRRRPPDGLLGGLWAFPETEPENLVMSRGLLAVGEAIELPTVVHRFTHLEATYVPVWQKCTEDDDTPSEPEDWAWVDRGDAGELALPVAQRKVFELWSEAKGGR